MGLGSRRRTNRGDTIVEVLIAIAVVSSVLAGAFTVTQKSARAVRDSQERGEMLQKLQGQVELVRSLALTATDNTTGVYATSPTYFCIKQTSPTPTRVIDTDPSCNNISNLYNVKVSYVPARNVFVFDGQWERLGGGTNTMRLTYRIDPGGA